MANIFLNSRFCGIICMLFVLGFTVGLLPGGVLNHGPVFPPNPWDEFAHGPVFPPNPWDERA